MTNTSGKAYLPALKGRIGSWAFYTTLMKFSEVKERIFYSEEIYQNRQLSDMIQRTITSSRASTISEYLKSDDERFFPAMVVAVFEGEPKWLEFSISSKSNNTEFDSSLLDLAKLDSFGFLELTGGEKLFPLDGQHRLAGIRKVLMDLPSDSDLPNDEISVMLVAHEPSDIGRIRSRRLFTVLNKRAVPVKKHETIALDEDDIMAIATRHLVEEFRPLSRNKVVSYRTEANIPSTDNTTFTTIITLYDTLHELFKSLKKRGVENLRFNRPNDDWLNTYLKTAETYFELVLRHFADIKICLESDIPSKIISKHRHKNGGHILFRPVGQKLLSQLVSTYIRRHWKLEFENSANRPDFALERTIECLNQAFNFFKDLPIDLAKPPYANLIWMPETRKMAVSRSSIVRDLILKRYDLITPRVDNGLNERLRRSVGERFSNEDFVWN